MTPFDFRPRTRVLFGAGEFGRLGEVARELGGTKCLVVADPGMVAAGYAREAMRTLKARRMEVFGFHDFDAGPTVAAVEAGAAYAAPLGINLIVGLGGGSSMDCAKAINFVVSTAEISAITGVTEKPRSRCCRWSPSLPRPVPAVRRRRLRWSTILRKI